MFSLLTKLRKRFAASSEPEAFSDLWMAKKYQALIIAQGNKVSETTLAAAQKLGLDVKALIAEHDRLQAASWEVEFSVDMERCLPEDPNLESLLLSSGVAARIVQTKAAMLNVYVEDVYARTDLAAGEIAVTEIVKRGLQALHGVFQKRADEFPSRLYPGQFRSFLLTRLCWNEWEQHWSLYGSWKKEVIERTPDKIHPELSLQRLRVPFDENRVLTSAIHFPHLQSVTLSVEKRADGTHVVNGVYATAEEAPEERPATEPGGSERLRLTFPSPNLPELTWDWHSSLWRGPLSYFVEQTVRSLSGKPADWLRSATREAVFVGPAKASPPDDLRASLASGPDGPAPLPAGMAWPVCPCCGEPTVFSQSLDMRNLLLSRLLPGTTIVIFACNECLDAGEWSNCTSLVWLPIDQEIELQSRRDPAALSQCIQCYGPDNDADLLDEQSRQLVWDDPAPLWLSSSHGTKAGGAPFYLQTETTFYDRDGVVMEYIAQIATPEHVRAGGFGYIYHSAKTGETYLVFQDT